MFSVGFREEKVFYFLFDINLWSFLCCYADSLGNQNKEEIVSCGF